MNRHQAERSKNHRPRYFSSRREFDDVENIALMSKACSMEKLMASPTFLHLSANKNTPENENTKNKWHCNHCSYWLNKIFGLIIDIFSMKNFKERATKETFGLIYPEGRSNKSVTIALSVNVSITQPLADKFMTGG